MIKEAVGRHFDIGKQKVVWILKCREWDEEATGNALIPLGFHNFIFFFLRFDFYHRRSM
jgi:hypothetical protein